MVCLFCVPCLPGRTSRAADSQPSLRAALLGEAAMPSQPPADKDEPATAQGGEEDEPGFGFDTPEEAVVAYLTGLKNADLEQMLSACAAGIFARRQDFALFLKRMRAFHSNFPYIPNTNSFLRDASFEVRRGALTRTIVLQYITVLIPELNMVGKTLPVEDEKAIGEYLALFGEERLGELASLAIFDMLKASEWAGSPETYRSERNMENMMRQTRTHGADDFENILAAFRVGEREFLFAPMVCRYDGRWLIADQLGPLGHLLDIPAFTGGLEKMN